VKLKPQPAVTEAQKAALISGRATQSKLADTQGKQELTNLLTVRNAEIKAQAVRDKGLKDKLIAQSKINNQVIEDAGKPFAITGLGLDAENGVPTCKLEKKGSEGEATALKNCLNNFGNIVKSNAERIAELSAGLLQDDAIVASGWGLDSGSSAPTSPGLQEKIEQLGKIQEEQKRNTEELIKGLDKALTSPVSNIDSADLLDEENLSKLSALATDTAQKIGEKHRKLGDTVRKIGQIVSQEWQKTKEKALKGETGRVKRSAEDAAYVEEVLSELSEVAANTEKQAAQRKIESVQAVADLQSYASLKKAIADSNRKTLVWDGMATNLDEASLVDLFRRKWANEKQLRRLRQLEGRIDHFFRFLQAKDSALQNELIRLSEQSLRRVDGIFKDWESETEKSLAESKKREALALTKRDVAREQKRTTEIGLQDKILEEQRKSWMDGSLKLLDLQRRLKDARTAANNQLKALEDNLVTNNAASQLSSLGVQVQQNSLASLSNARLEALERQSVIVEDGQTDNTSLQRDILKQGALNRGALSAGETQRLPLDEQGAEFQNLWERNSAEDTRKKLLAMRQEEADIAAELLKHQGIQARQKAAYENSLRNQALMNRNALVDLDIQGDRAKRQYELNLENFYQAARLKSESIEHKHHLLADKLQLSIDSATRKWKSRYESIKVALEKKKRDFSDFKLNGNLKLIKKQAQHRQLESTWNRELEAVLTEFEKSAALQAAEHQRKMQEAQTFFAQANLKAKTHSLRHLKEMEIAHAYAFADKELTSMYLLERLRKESKFRLQSVEDRLNDLLVRNAEELAEETQNSKKVLLQQLFEAYTMSMSGDRALLKMRRSRYEELARAQQALIHKKLDAIEAKTQSLDELAEIRRNRFVVDTAAKMAEIIQKNRVDKRNRVQLHAGILSQAQNRVHQARSSLKLLGEQVQEEIDPGTLKVLQNDWIRQSTNFQKDQEKLKSDRELIHQRNERTLQELKAGQRETLRHLKSDLNNVATGTKPKAHGMR